MASALPRPGAGRHPSRPGTPVPAGDGVTGGVNFRIARVTVAAGGWHASWYVAGMTSFYLPDAAALRDAEQLIANMGGDAENEANARAARSRDIGNHIAFCRWRQIGRLIAFLGDDGVEAPTLH